MIWSPTALAHRVAFEEGDGGCVEPKEIQGQITSRDDGDASGPRSLHVGAVKVLHSASASLLCSCTWVKTQIPSDWAATMLAARHLHGGVSFSDHGKVVGPSWLGGVQRQSQSGCS